MNGKWKMLLCMGIFGSVGIFVRLIPLPPTVIAFCRGVLGCLFLLLLLVLTGKKLSLPQIRKNLPVLILSGTAIGINWVLLFAAYRHTTVAIATVCYYLAPAFVTLASPLVGEKLTGKKLACIAVALFGMVCVSGVFQSSQQGSFLGVALGVGAAVFYASVMLLNKKLSPIGDFEKTLCQLGTAALVIAPFLLLDGSMDFSQMTTLAWGMLAVVGIVHTGIAYALYFGALASLNAQTAAILSYLDPVLSILLSALILHERLDMWSILGTILILGSSLFSDLPVGKR